MTRTRRSDIDAPLPDDPIFAAFGIDPEEAEMAQAKRRPPRRLGRIVAIAGLSAVILTGSSICWRQALRAAHADTLPGTITAANPAPANPAASNDEDAFAKAMNQAMMNMHMAMGVPYSGDADRDFARMMIPHHQGAIDMAKLELQYGKDPRLRRLAEEIIVTQQQEIAVMQLVLKDIAAGQATPPAPQGGMEMNGMQMPDMQMQNMRMTGDHAATTAP